jgi:hypothetical protein
VAPYTEIITPELISIALIGSLEKRLIEFSDVIAYGSSLEKEVYPEIGFFCNGFLS